MHDTFSRSNTDTESSHLKSVWCSVQEKSGSSNLVGGRKCNQFRIILASSNCASRRRAPSFMACQMFVPWRRGWVEEEKKGWSVTENLEFILKFVPAINQRWSEGHKGKKTIHVSRFLSFTNYFHSLSILILSVLQYFYWRSDIQIQILNPLDQPLFAIRRFCILAGFRFDMVEQRSPVEKWWKSDQMWK